MFKQCSFPLNTIVFNITEHVQGVQYLLRFWRSDGVLNLNTNFYSVVFDLFCIFRENTHEQQLIQAKILYQCPSRNILDFVYGGSHFSTGVIFLLVRHVKNRPLWHFFYTWDTFFLRPGVISLRRKLTPRSIFDGGRYSSLHRPRCKESLRKTREQRTYRCRRLWYSEISHKIWCQISEENMQHRTKTAATIWRIFKETTIVHRCW